MKTVCEQCQPDARSVKTLLAVLAIWSKVKSPTVCPNPQAVKDFTIRGVRFEKTQLGPGETVFANASNSGVEVDLNHTQAPLLQTPFSHPSPLTFSLVGMSNTKS